MKIKAVLVFLFMLVLIFASAGGQSSVTVCAKGARPCDCIANACCVPWCPTCCGNVACSTLTDEEVKAFEGKHK